MCEEDVAAVCVEAVADVAAAAAEGLSVVKTITVEELFYFLQKEVNLCLVEGHNKIKHLQRVQLHIQYAYLSQLLKDTV